MPPPVPLLRVTDLAVELVVEHHGALRPVRVVNGVGLSIDRGEALGLVGESGSGKSMTAWALLGLLPPIGRIAGGRIDFEGRDITHIPERERRTLRGARIGFIGQDSGSALNPVIAVGDQVADAILAHRPVGREVARRQAIDLLDAVRIPNAAERARHYPHQLSGGQRQRVLLAAALANKPSLLVADEPTTALDVTVQAEILDLLRHLRATLELSLLLITHDLGVVASVTDRVAVMYAGHFVEVGPTRDVLTRPRHPYTRGLLASVPGAAPGTRLTTIPGTIPDMLARPPGCPFAPRCPDVAAACLTAVPPLTPVGPGRYLRCTIHGGPA